MTELREKIEAEIARLKPLRDNPENYFETRVRLAVKVDALEWVLREIEALAPVGVGEEKGIVHASEPHPPVITPNRTPTIHEGAWQPIETAPKDGTVVMVWDDGDACVDVLFWTAGRWENLSGYPVVDEPITHWMPLPEGPKQDGRRPGPIDNGSATPLRNEQKTPSPTPLGAEDLERAAQQIGDETLEGMAVYIAGLVTQRANWLKYEAECGGDREHLGTREKECRYIIDRWLTPASFKIAFLALNLPVEPGR